MKHGDFSSLAKNYANYRPAYSPMVLDVILGMLPEKIKGADVGAGTGIWTKMLADKNVIMDAVEPNDEMRAEGAKFAPQVTWHKGSAEVTGLQDNMYDFVSMASSFHWADYDIAMKEFQRILKPGAYFIALWNPRKIENNPLLIDIENKLYSYKPDMQRKSSGNSTFCNGLFDKLKQTAMVEDVVYLEGEHIEKQSLETYIGLWRSVNDIQVQLGADNFEDFIQYIRTKVKSDEIIEAHYKTRAWIAKIKK